MIRYFRITRGRAALPRLSRIVKNQFAYLPAVLLLATGCVDKSEPSGLPEACEVHSVRLIFIGDVMSHTPQLADAMVDARALRTTEAVHVAAGETTPPTDMRAGRPPGTVPSPPGGIASPAGTQDTPVTTAAGSARTIHPPAARTTPRYDYTEVFSHFAPIFGEADVVVANLETTLRSSPPYTGFPTFAAPGELAFAMKEAGIDIVTTANNHICDKGAAGIRSTLSLLDSAALMHTGAFVDSADMRARNPLRFTAGGIRFALLGYTYGTNGIPTPKGMHVNLIDTTLVARDLASARDYDTDCVIVSYHWGEEYRTEPLKAQRELARWTRARGADIIIGGHPHVVQTMEAHYDADSTAVTGATYYSLGNFVSNQRRRRTDGGIAAQIVVTRRVRPASPSSPTPSSHSASSSPMTPPSSPTPPSHPASSSSTSGRHSEQHPHPANPYADIGYDFAYRLLWVHTQYRDGVRHYSVVPSSLADTIPAARTFLDDTRRLLSTVDTVFTEL